MGLFDNILKIKRGYVLHFGDMLVTDYNYEDIHGKPDLRYSAVDGWHEEWRDGHEFRYPEYHSVRLDSLPEETLEKLRNDILEGMDRACFTETHVQAIRHPGPRRIKQRTEAMLRAALKEIGNAISALHGEQAEGRTSGEGA